MIQDGFMKCANWEDAWRWQILAVETHLVCLSGMLLKFDGFLIDLFTRRNACEIEMLVYFGIIWSFGKIVYFGSLWSIDVES